MIKSPLKFTQNKTKKIDKRSKESPGLTLHVHELSLMYKGWLLLLMWFSALVVQKNQLGSISKTLLPPETPQDFDFTGLYWSQGMGSF